MDTWLGSAHVRVANKHPELGGYIVCPYSIPGRPGHIRLSSWLKSGAPEHVKDYCREGLKWTKGTPGCALPGFKRLEAELRG